MHIYKIYLFDDEWLPLFNCTIARFGLIIDYADQLPTKFFLIEETTKPENDPAYIPDLPNHRTYINNYPDVRNTSTR